MRQPLRHQPRLARVTSHNWGFHKWHNVKPTPSPFNPFLICRKQSWPIKRRSLHHECVPYTPLRYHYMPLNWRRALVSWLMKSFTITQNKTHLRLFVNAACLSEGQIKTLLCVALAHTEKKLTYLALPLSLSLKFDSRTLSHMTRYFSLWNPLPFYAVSTL